MPIARLDLSFLDSQNSSSKVSIPLAGITVDNFTTQVAQAIFATGSTIANLIAACSIGAPLKSDIFLEGVVLSPAVPANKYAQRELGLEVSYKDTVTGKKYHLTIPAPDWDNMGTVGTNLVNQLSSKWIGLKSGLEDGMVSPVGNPILVTGGHLIGRRK
jgi:hypothetical protein